VTQHKTVGTFQILKHRTLNFEGKGKEERIIAVNEIWRMNNNF
jgi:hypothetical protein